MEKKSAKIHKPIEIRLKSDLNPIWVDNINIGMREDNITFIRFLTNLPEGMAEQVQIMTSKEHLKKFIDVLCSSVNYYPTKKESSIKNKQK